MKLKNWLWVCALVGLLTLPAAAESTRFGLVGIKCSPAFHLVDVAPLSLEGPWSINNPVLHLGRRPVKLPKVSAQSKLLAIPEFGPPMITYRAEFGTVATLLLSLRPDGSVVGGTLWVNGTVYQVQ